MNLQALSEACFATPIDLFFRGGEDLAGELQRRCLAALADASGAPVATWAPRSVVFHRSPNAAIAAGAATTTGWVERLGDNGDVVFRVVATSWTGVERVDASLAFARAASAVPHARAATWCDCVAAPVRRRAIAAAPAR